MMNMRINKQPLWYAMYLRQEETYQLDEYGEIIYDEIDGELVPRMSGHYEPSYDMPVKFFGNINSGNVGESVARAYGVSVGDFEAVLCMHKGELPIDEQTIIWYGQEPRYIIDGSISAVLDDDGENFIADDGTIIPYTSDLDVHVDHRSADYKVKRVPPCLDEIIYLLGRLDNNGEDEDN